MPRPTSESLEALFDPRSIALLGASDDPAKLGNVTLRNLRAGGYRGRIYPVNPRLAEIDGLKCYDGPAALPEPVDLAFLTVPARATPDAVRACAAAGAKVAIVGSAGFAEAGDDGARLQTELQDTARRADIRLVGPNCNGIYRTANGLALGFNTGHARSFPRGSVTILSHSGALFDSMATQLAGLGAGLSTFVSAGNEADLDILHYLEFAVGDDDTRVVALLVDYIPGAARFREIAARAHAAGKHIVVLKIGDTDAGLKAAVAHSSRLASDARSYGAIFEQANVATVTTIEALMSAAALLAAHGRVEGGLAAFSTSGAGASLVADLAEQHRVPLARFSDRTARTIAGEQKGASIGNPTDVGVYGGIAPQVPTHIARDPGVGAMAAMMHAMLPVQRGPFLKMLDRARQASAKPFVVFSPGPLSDEERADYATHGFTVLGDTDSAMQALSAMLLARRNDAPALSPAPAGLGTLSFPAPGPLSEPDSLSLLRQFGIPAVETLSCRNVDEAIDAAGRLGWPVVLKGVVDGIGHKTEHDLVRLDIRDAAALRSAFEAMGAPDALAVQPFLPGELELIAGLTRAADTGTVLLAGLGGIHAEALRDVVMWPVPTGEDEIRRKLAAASVGKVLNNPRAPRAQAFEGLVGALLGLQSLALAAGEALAAADINPLVVRRDGVVAVDGLVVAAGPVAPGTGRS